MLALIAIMTVGIELRDANATPTTIAVSDVNMTDASANAILEYDTVAHIFKQVETAVLSNTSREWPPALMRRLLFEHWNHTKKPRTKMIVPGKGQKVIKDKLARLKKALAPDIFNIYEGRDASETSALQGAIREAMKSIRESDPIAIASPGIAKAPPCTFPHNPPCRLCRSHLNVSRSQCTENQQQFNNNSSTIKEVAALHAVPASRAIARVIYSVSSRAVAHSSYLTSPDDCHSRPASRSSC
mmetsp:Transcript_38505/g.120888  ORF Transcript_38505/g.120888 Transcript_38505/m.120888 type:complete len:243 (-) Transcript_38505:1503-2231(-)